MHRMSNNKNDRIMWPVCGSIMQTRVCHNAAKTKPHDKIKGYFIIISTKQWNKYFIIIYNVLKPLKFAFSASLPSVLWRCWLGGRKGIQPVKNFEWWGTGMVICLERDADLQVAQLMPLPLTVSCFSKIQIGFTFLVPAQPGSPGKKAVKRGVYCISLRQLLIVWH